MFYQLNWLIVFSLFFSTVCCFSQTGRIRGTVCDSENKTPLAYANIWLEPANRGTVSNDSGEFVLMNVPAGDHCLNIQFMGYKTLQIQSVTVTPDLTTHIQAFIEKTVLVTPGLAVAATAPRIRIDATGDRKVFAADVLSELPFESMKLFMDAQSGTVLLNDQLHIRGGRADELGVFLDGVRMNNPYDQHVDPALCLSSLEQLSYEPGAMGARYGGNNAGVIHLTSKQGGPQLGGQVDLSTDQWLSEEESCLGASYGFRRIQGELHGPVPFTKKRFRFYAGLDYLNEKDKSPSWQKKVMPSAFVVSIDSLREINPEPVWQAGPKEGNERKQWQFLFNLSGRCKTVYFKTGGRWQSRKDQLYQHARSVFNQAHIAEMNRQDFSFFFQGHWFVTSSFYLAMDANTLRYQAIQQDPVVKDHFLIWTDPDIIPNISNWGEMVPLMDDFALFQGHGRVYGNYSKDESVRNTLRIHGAWDVTSNHHLDFGLEQENITMRYYNLPFSVSPALHRLLEDCENNKPTKEEQWAVYNQYADYTGYDPWGRSHDCDASHAPARPWNRAFYIQENYENPHFICQAGFRLDNFHVGQKRLKDPYVIPLSANGAVDMTALAKPADYVRLSPRLGVAFPVTDKSGLHFHYGRNVQAAPYACTLLNWHTVTDNLQAGTAPFLANPGLKPVTSVACEAGMDIEVHPRMVFDVTCFYKEIHHQIQMRRFSGAEPLSYTTFVNGDYGTSKGFTWDVLFQGNRHFNGHCAYTLMWSDGTGSNPYSQMPLTLNHAIDYPTMTSPLDYDQRHSFHAAVTLKTANHEGPVCQQKHPFGNLSCLVWFAAGSGLPFTRREVTSQIFDMDAGLPVGQINGQRQPASFLCHIRIQKTWQSGLWTIQPYVSILNLNNYKNIKGVYESSGMTDTDGWLSTPEGAAWQEANPEKAAWYQARLADPDKAGMPRQIRLGCRLQF